MRAWVCLLPAVAGIFLAGASAFAQTSTREPKPLKGDPKALLNDIYQPYTQHQRPADPSLFYSDGLKALFAHHAELSEISGVGMPPHPLAPADNDFDPFVNAKSYLIFDLDIGDPVIDGDRAMASVSYRNFDHPSELSISMIKGADGWKVDDVASLGADQHWLLS